MNKLIQLPEFHSCLDKPSKNDVIIDVRTPEEFQSGHVPGARNIPHDTIANHAAQLKGHGTIYLYCRSGGRVQTACNALQSLGFNNLVGLVGGGMPNWIEAGYPVEK